MSKPGVDWHGVQAVIVTPFSADGALDEAAYRQVVEFVIDAGCHGVIAAGSTGEFYLMSDEERGRVFDIAVDQAAGRVPVIGCPAAIRIEDTIALTRRAAEAGCAGVMALTPLYISLSEREIVDYYRRLSGEGGLPIMLYNSPKLVNNTLPAPLVSELMELEQVVAIKDTTWDLYTTIELIRQCGPDLRVFVGLEDLFLPALSVGAGRRRHDAPGGRQHDRRSLWTPRGRATMTGRRRFISNSLRAYDIFKVGSGYVGIKEAMNLLGRPGGHSRPPMLPYTEGQKDQLREILNDLGLLEPAARMKSA